MLWIAFDDQASDEQIRRRSDQGDNQGNRPDDIKRSVSSSIGRPVVNERQTKYYMLFYVPEGDVKGTWEL